MENIDTNMENEKNKIDFNTNNENKETKDNKNNKDNNNDNENNKDNNNGNENNKPNEYDISKIPNEYLKNRNANNDNVFKRDINLNNFFSDIKIIINNNKNNKMILKIFILIIILLINELIYCSIFTLFFYNVLGEYTDLIFSFINLFFLINWGISLYHSIMKNCNEKIFILAWIYLLIYIFIMIKSFFYNPWYFPFYLLFTFLNLGLIIINYLN